jgi:hypothetical protein
MIFYLIVTDAGYFSGFRSRWYNWFRTKPEFHWDLTLKSGPLKLYLTEKEAWEFLTVHRNFFPVVTKIIPHEFAYIAGMGGTTNEDPATTDRTAPRHEVPSPDTHTQQ